MTGSNLLKPYGPIVATIMVLAVVPLWFSDSRSMMTVITTGMVFGAYAIGFNLIFGSTGQLFLCVGALAGIGGFGSAILTDRVGLPMVLGIVVAGLAAGLFAAVLSWVAVSRSLDTIFTGIVTLTFSLSYESFILGRRDLTGGENGLPISSGAGSVLAGRVSAYYLFLALVGLYLVLYRLIQRSHLGWAFRALRDDETAAELAGVDVARHRIYAGLMGGVMLGVAGAMFAHHRSFIGDSTYAFGNVDVRVLVMLAFGGIGSLLGPVLGAATFTALDEILVDYAQLREALYGVVALILFLGFRRGAVPAVLSGWARVFGRVGSDDQAGEQVDR